MKMNRPGKKSKYVLEQDRESENPTEFELTRLTWEQLDDVNSRSVMSLSDAAMIMQVSAAAKAESRELTDVERQTIDDITKMDADKVHQLNLQHAKACEYGLQSVGTLYDGKEAFTLDPAQFIAASNAAVLRELGIKIISLSRYSEDEVKN